MGILRKTLLYDNEISVSLLETTDIVNEAIAIHGLSPLAAAGLGRTMTACAFMASCMKGEDDRLSVTIDGDGAGGRIVVAADAALHIRGCIDHPEATLPPRADGKLNVGGLVGKGRMTVVKNIGLKEPYVGRCELVSGEIAEDFAAYYAISEQQPTGMALGVRIGTDGKCLGAGGLVLQPLPGCREESIAGAEALLAQFKDISSMVEKGGLEGIWKDFFAGNAYEDRYPVYRCNCSRDYIDGVLVTLGEKELRDSLAQEGKIEVCCQFCNRKYVYTEEDVTRLLAEGSSPKGESGGDNEPEDDKTDGANEE
mgnify:FL=1